MIKNNDSKRILIAGIALCGMIVFLAVFTVMVYKEKRKSVEDYSGDFETGLVSEDSAASEQEEITSEPEDTVSSAAESTVSSEAGSTTAKNVYVESPDYKSDYYMVVFTGTQSILVYQKDKDGEYTVRFHEMLCSTGKTDSTPTKEGVYSLSKKERWSTLSNNSFCQYGCQITGTDNYIIGSTPFSKKKAWTMTDGEYENIGKACTSGNIQLCVRDANWIYQNMPVGTQIHVINASDPESKNLSLPKRKAANGGWDPTDKWSKGNPYFG